MGASRGGCSGSAEGAAERSGVRGAWPRGSAAPATVRLSGHPARCGRGCEASWGGRGGRGMVWPRQQAGGGAPSLRCRLAAPAPAPRTGLGSVLTQSVSVSPAWPRAGSPFQASPPAGRTSKPGAGAPEPCHGPVRTRGRARHTPHRQAAGSAPSVPGASWKRRLVRLCRALGRCGVQNEHGGDEVRLIPGWKLLLFPVLPVLRCQLPPSSHHRRDQAAGDCPAGPTGQGALWGGCNLCLGTHPLCVQLLSLSRGMEMGQQGIVRQSMLR